MNSYKRNRLNAAQNHVAGAAYAPDDFVRGESHTSLLHVSGHSQQGPPAFCDLPDILIRGKFSKSHLYNLMARGHFPQPVLRMGPRFTRWSAEQCDQWFTSPIDWINAHVNNAQVVSS